MATILRLRSGQVSVRLAMAYRPLPPDATGGLVSQARYTPFGEVSWEGGLEAPTDFGFTGQRREGFGLMDYHARFYSPYLNRFAQADSIVPGAGNPMAWDRYAYGLNNPVKHVDPSGHRTCTSQEAATGDESCQQNYNVDEMVQYLQDTYNWTIVGDDWTIDDIVLITEVARDIRDFVEKVSDADGAAWIRDNLTSQFHYMHGIPSYTAGNHVIYNPDTIAGNKQFVAHELGHVFDNNHKYVPGPCYATVCGGGPSEAVMLALGGSPGSLPIFDNGPATLPSEYQFSRKSTLDVNGDPYGNGSTTEYFGEVFAWAIYDQSKMHDDVYGVFLALLGTTW